MNKAPYIAGVCVILAMIGYSWIHDEPTPAATPVVSAPATAPFTLREIMVQSMLDATGDKGRTVLFQSVNAPRIKLYDTTATHPACTFNGKPMQVLEADNGGFGCYLWVGDQVAMRVEGDQLAMFPRDRFIAK